MPARETNERGVMRKIPVGQTIRYAYGFLFGHFTTVIGLIWVPVALASVVIFGATDAYLAGQISYYNTQNPGALAPGVFAMLFGMAVAVFLYAVASVALTRQALGLREGPARAAFTLGRAEWHLFVAYLAYFGILVLLAIFAGMVVGLAAGGAANGAGTTGSGLAALAILFVLGLMIYAGLRAGFFLAPAVVADGAGLKRSWDLARGQVLRVLVIALAIGLPLGLLQLGAEVLLLGAQVTFGQAASTTQRTMEQAVAMRDSLPLLTLVNGVFYILSIGLIVPAAAFAYRALAPGETRFAETV
jgi:hypothetical protein